MLVLQDGIGYEQYHTNQYPLVVRNNELPSVCQPRLLTHEDQSMIEGVVAGKGWPVWAVAATTVRAYAKIVKLGPSG